MLQRRRLLAAAALACAAGAARARSAPPEVVGALAGARLVGSHRLRWFGLSVYEARLWSNGPLAAADWAARPLALEIEYARAFTGRAIAERSLAEMRRQGPIDETTAARWLATMQALFPDVTEGDRLTGLHEPDQGARFFANGTPRGEVREPVFARRFFGIWLSEAGSQPALRRALLGLGA